jgi:hypothetical protein
MPIVMIVGSILACLVYTFEGDFRRAIYWASAAVVNASVTF